MANSESDIDNLREAANSRKFARFEKLRELFFHEKWLLVISNEYITKQNSQKFGIKNYRNHFLPIMRLATFDYMSEIFGFSERQNCWTDDVCKLYSNTSRDERAKAGFVPIVKCDRNYLKCQFCNVVIREPVRDELLMSDHIKASPGCPLVQSETNFIPRNPK